MSERGDFMFVPRGSVIETDKHMNELYAQLDALRADLAKAQEQCANKEKANLQLQEQVKIAREALEYYDNHIPKDFYCKAREALAAMDAVKGE